jgi:hypothetical protein
MLSDEIARAKQREQIAAFERNEANIAAGVIAVVGPESVAGNDERRLFAPFVKWCDAQGIRYCPAKPATVAAFVCAESLPPDRLLGTLAAIAQIHDEHRLSNPVATAIVSRALDRTITVEPPRSWPKADKAAFLFLPKQTQAIIARRERDRDRELRRLQSAASKRQTDDAAKTVEPKEEMQHAKEEA